MVRAVCNYISLLHPDHMNKATHALGLELTLGALVGIPVKIETWTREVDSLMGIYGYTHVQDFLGAPKSNLVQLRDFEFPLFFKGLNSTPTAAWQLRADFGKLKVQTRDLEFT